MAMMLGIGGEIMALREARHMIALIPLLQAHCRRQSLVVLDVIDVSTFLVVFAP